MIADFNLAVRLLARRPAVTALIVAMLALGIGATTAVASLVRTVLVRPLPYANPAQVVLIWETQWAATLPQGGDIPRTLTRTHAEAYRRATSFESVALLSSWSENWQSRLDLATPDGAERLRGAFVTPGFFDVLGVRAALGRTFEARDEESGEPLVVLSDGLWRRRFGADAAAIGQAIDLRRLDGGLQRYTIVGVLPPAVRFTYPRETEAWVLRGWSEGHYPAAADLQEFQMVARLRPGVSPAQAQAELVPLLRDALHGTGLPEDEIAAHAPLVERITDHVAAQARPGLLLLSGVTGLVLLIACVNVSVLLLAVLVDRQRDIALRAALGAGWWRLARQRLAEGVILASAGTTAGIGLAWASMPALRDLVPATMPRGTELSLDGATLGFTAAVAVLTVLVCTLLPMVLTPGRRIQWHLQRTGLTATHDRRVTGWRRAAVASQTAIVVMLLVTASLLLQSLARLQRIDPGFSADGVIAMEALLLHPKYGDRQQIAAFDRTMRERILAVPGVAQVSLATVVSGDGYAQAIIESGCLIHAVDRSFFEVMGIALRAGRWFTAGEDQVGPLTVAIVSERCAQRLADDGDVVGRRVPLGTTEAVTVAGIVDDARYEGVKQAPAPALYLARAQVSPNATRIFVRPTDGAGDVTPVVVAAARSVDPEQPVELLGTIDGLVREQMAQERFQSVSAAAFALLALLLAAGGLAGTVARTVSERTRELALRAALGAGPRQLVSRIMGQGLRPVAAGAAAGLCGAVALSRLIEGFLFEVSPLDPLAYAAAAATLAGTAAIACYLPARRALLVDPAVALRAE